MIIYFIYKSSSFNFNIKNDVSITYLKNLASKMINKDKTCFDLFYNNKILSENDSSLFHLSNNQTNISIIISLKKNNSNKSNINLPLLTLPNKANLNLNLNESEICSDSFSREINKNPKNFMKRKIGNDKLTQKKEEYITINKVFEDVYNSKDKEIISLLNNLANKILEFDDTLYKKYKTSYSKDNSQLLLYEKNIMNFKDKQIQNLKKLINNFDNYKSSFISKGKINLDEFDIESHDYNQKKNTNNIATKINTNKISFEPKDSSKNSKKDNIILSNKNLKLSSNAEQKLPTISAIKKPEDNLNLNDSDKVSDNTDSSDEISKEKIYKNDKILEKKKIIDNKIKNDIYLSKSTKIQNNKKLDLKENMLSKKITEKNNENRNLFMKKNITMINEENEENSKNIDSHQIDNKNNKIEENNFKKIENKIDKKINNKINTNKAPMKKNKQSERKNHMETFNKDKINALLDDSEEQNKEDSENDLESEDENEKRNKRFSMIRLKTINYNQNKNLKNAYSIRNDDKRKSRRLKKLGTNVYDFLI